MKKIYEVIFRYIDVIIYIYIIYKIFFILMSKENKQKDVRKKLNVIFDSFIYNIFYLNLYDRNIFLNDYINIICN